MLNVKYGKRGGFGPNLVSSEHEEWRKHRRIAGPSFSEKNNRLVWDSSIEVILGYFNKWSRGGKGRIVKVDNFTEVTTQIAYMVFTVAGMRVECAACLSLTTLLTLARLWYECGLGRGSGCPCSGSFDAVHGSTESICGSTNVSRCCPQVDPFPLSTWSMCH
jgi:hypothetical protein